MEVILVRPEQLPTLIIAWLDAMYTNDGGGPCQLPPPTECVCAVRN